MSRIQEELRRSSVAELRQRDEEITELRTTVKKLERTVQTKSAELEDTDFRDADRFLYDPGDPFPN